MLKATTRILQRSKVKHFLASRGMFRKQQGVHVKAVRNKLASKGMRQLYRQES